MILLYMFLLILAAAIGLFVIYLIIPLPPLPTQSDWEHRLPGFFQIYYSHKYIFPIRMATLGSGLKRHFASQDFNFKAVNSPATATITIRASGDLLFRPDMTLETASSLWDEVGPWLFGANLSIGNLECAVNPDKVIHKTLQYSIAPKHAEPLLGAPRHGYFKALTIGNNHINDSGFEGITSTCRYLDQKGIIHTGASRTPQEQNNTPIIDVKGVKIALLSWTFGTNAHPPLSQHGFSVNLARFNALKDKDYNPAPIINQIHIARERGADYVILCNHWGVEFEYYPPPRIVKRAQELCEAGADCIIGHHPHILNPVERLQTRDNRDCVIFYSLGNLTNWALLRPIQKLSELAELVLDVYVSDNARPRVVPRQIRLMPVWHHFGRSSSNTNHRLIPVIAALKKKSALRQQLPASTIRQMQEAMREYNRFFIHPGIEYL